MILVLKPGVTPDGASALEERLRSLGANVTSKKAGDRLVLDVEGSFEGVLGPEVLPLVESVLQESPTDKGSTPVWPDVVLSHGALICALLAGLILLAAFLPPGLAERADPLSPPEDVHPGWYFAAMYRILKFFPPGTEFLGVVCILALLLAFVGLPFIDRSEARSFVKRPFAWFGVALGLFLVIMTLVGVFS